MYFVVDVTEGLLYSVSYDCIKMGMSLHADKVFSSLSLPCVINCNASKTFSQSALRNLHSVPSHLVPYGWVSPIVLTNR